MATRNIRTPNGFESIEVPEVRSFAQMTNLADNTINSTPAPGILFGSWDVGSAQVQGSSVSPEAAGWRINEDGIYDVSAMISMQRVAGGSRFSVALRLAVNGGAGVGPLARTGYIRNATGHIRSSVEVTSTLFGLVAGDLVQIRCVRDSSQGNPVNALPGLGRFSIERKLP